MLFRIADTFTGSLVRIPAMWIAHSDDVDHAPWRAALGPLYLR